MLLHSGNFILFLKTNLGYLSQLALKYAITSTNYFMIIIKLLYRGQRAAAVAQSSFIMTVKLF